MVEDLLSLADWRRRIADLYGRVRTASDPYDAWKTWRSTRDELFRHHPQSPLPEQDRSSFSQLNYFEHDPALRVRGIVEPASTKRYDIGTSGPETLSFTRFAAVRFELGGGDRRLELYWLEGYGGGIFLPFHDVTSGKETYGAGRYLLDTVKGADLGMDGGALLLDFNFAYNPSCSYDARWVCPLAPPENHMEVEVRAGELAP